MNDFRYTLVNRTLPGDLHTPVSAYLRLRDASTGSILMESSDYHGGQDVKKTKRLTAGIGDLVKAHLFTGEDIVVRVVASEYDCLEEKYTSITIGEKLYSFSRLLAKDIKGN